MIDPAKTLVSVPPYPLDQVIGILTGSLSVGASASATATKATGLPDRMYFEGLWSRDGGASWIDMDGDYFSGVIAGSGIAVCTVSAVSYPDGTMQISANNGIASVQNISYKLALIARVDQGDITPLPIARTYHYRSRQNYMKIWKQNIVDVAAGVTAPIVHGLTYVPNVKVWVELDFGGTIVLARAGHTNVTVDGTNLYLTNPSGASRKYHYRIYLDG
jgi:hypothetical protein